MRDLCLSKAMADNHLKRLSLLSCGKARGAKNNKKVGFDLAFCLGFALNAEMMMKMREIYLPTTGSRWAW